MRVDVDKWLSHRNQTHRKSTVEMQVVVLHYKVARTQNPFHSESEEFPSFVSYDTKYFPQIVCHLRGYQGSVDVYVSSLLHT